MNALLFLIGSILRLLEWALIIQAVMSWLIAFGVINRYNGGVRAVYDTLTRITEPLLRPIRRILPNLGGVDISFIILILLIEALRIFIFADLPLLGAGR
jgi:YggT family protein